jgi:exosome complex exonuclease DIS3/RRP44
MSDFDFNICGTFVGILHTSSAISYTTNKVGMIKKEFTPFLHIPYKILVKTKKVITCPDLYSIVKFESIDTKTNVVTCIVHEYLDEIRNITIFSLLKSLSTCHWTRGKDKLCRENIEIDLTPDRWIPLLDDIEIYSIDPLGCEDIDDALHCKKTEVGWEIGIHIADVSSYIPEGSQLDIEFAKRSETFYSDHPILPNQNMIPDILSINRMSLKVGKQSRAFSVIVNYDSYFNIININFTKSLIIVKQNLSYENSQHLIDTNSNLVLKNMYNFGKTLYTGLNVYDTHEMVAVFMILANRLVAEYLQAYDSKSVILRTQGSNTRTGIYNIPNTINQKLQDRHSNSLYERAIYQAGSGSSDHTTLGLKYYTHFTSPIRRYIDIMVHRELYKALRGEKLELPNKFIIDNINFYSKMYKKLQRHTRLLHTIESLEDTNFDAYIISLNSDKNKIRVYIEQIDLELDIKLIHKKISQIMENISDDENELLIANTQNATGISLTLFQKLKVKLSKQIQYDLFSPVSITVIDPPIYDLLGIN